MKSKKFVLAALALLAAITMVLLPLAGCKNDTVPPEVEKQEQGDGGGSETDKNNTAAKLVSISVTTPPARTVYSEGQEFDHTDMVVTATYDDKPQREVTGWTTNFNTVVTEKGLAKTVTVSYMEGGITREDTFIVDVASYQFTETVQDVDPSYTGTKTDGIYKKFGDWPQTIKEESVDIGDETLVRGGLTYHVGNDGNYYVKAEEKAYDAGYKYSDDSEVKQKDESGSPSTRWFKVEPIVWRVLTRSYEAPEDGTAGNALLLAEKILTGDIPYYDVWNINRTVDEATIYPNNYEHSAVRAWLNGLEYPYKGPDDVEQIKKRDYFGKGFLQTAFTESAQTLIAETTVDNTAASTNPASDPNLWEEGKNPYASDTPTKDKIFLLSEEEATTGVYLKEKGITDEDYGFDEYYASGEGSTRIRVTTDYAKATGAYQDSTEGYGGWCWLRSPHFDYVDRARVISSNGYADVDDGYVINADGGVVPALSISLGGN